MIRTDNLTAQLFEDVFCLLKRNAEGFFANRIHCVLISCEMKNAVRVSQ